MNPSKNQVKVLPGARVKVLRAKVLRAKVLRAKVLRAKVLPGARTIIHVGEKNRPSGESRQR
ncbi:MAG: hypothetical protein R3E60_03360 [Alphaproteobacteria bacterium]